MSSLKRLAITTTAVAAAQLAWSVLALGAGLVGFRFATSTSSPAVSEVLVQQWNPLVLPFLPTILAAAPLAPALHRVSSRRVAAGVGALAAPLAFIATMAASYAASERGTGYAAEQGMAVLAVILVPLVALTASPFWAIAAGLVWSRVRRRA